MLRISTIAFLLIGLTSGAAVSEATSPGIDTFSTSAISPSVTAYPASGPAGISVEAGEIPSFGRPPSLMALEMVGWDEFQGWPRLGNPGTLGLVVAHCGPLSIHQVDTILRGSAEVGVLVAAGCPTATRDEVQIHFIRPDFGGETQSSSVATRLPLIDASKTDCTTLEQAALGSSLSGVVVFADKRGADECSLGYFDLLESVADSPKQRARLKLARAQIMRQWISLE